MIKYAKYVVPYFMKAPRRNPVRNLAGFALAYLFLAIAFLFFFVAAFIWLTKEFGSEIAFAATGGALVIAGSALLLSLRRTTTVSTPMPTSLSHDPLAQYVPESVRENPTMQKLLHQVGESPVTATATAVTLGMLLSRELFEDQR